MAADWYYVANQQQAGPVELQALIEMLQAGTVAANDSVFGPGLTEWTRAAQVPALRGAAGPSSAPIVDAGLLAYRGVETGNAGISERAMDLLRQTKPWARFVSVMIFIGAGLMVLGGVGMGIVGAMAMRGGPALPAGLALVYGVLGLLYVAPAIFLGRFASAIARLMSTRKMSDLEDALAGQKSFWKFVGILMIILLGVYAVVIVVLIATRAKF